MIRAVNVSRMQTVNAWRSMCAYRSSLIQSLRERKIRGRDSVSGPQRLEFHKDLCLTQGVRLECAPSFLVTSELLFTFQAITSFLTQIISIATKVIYLSNLLPKVWWTIHSFTPFATYNITQNIINFNYVAVKFFNIKHCVYISHLSLDKSWYALCVMTFNPCHNFKWYIYIDFYKNK